MRKFMTAGTALALSLAFAATAQADTVTTTFDDFSDGSVGGQNDWTAGDLTHNYDQAVVPYAGGKALRISNEVADGSFAWMPYSAPVAHAAGENEGNNVLVNKFKFKAPDTLTPGLAVSVSPTGFQGTRMSYLRFEDSDAGVKVVFRDGANLVDQQIALLDRNEHMVKFETTFIQGHDNDVVRVSIDGDEKIRGGSWESYYHVWEERYPVATDRLMWRLNLDGTTGQPCPAVCNAPALHGNGFLFDDVTSESSYVPNPAPLHPPAPGPAGQNGTNGTNGTNGANGKDGVTTIIREGEVAGARMRTIRPRNIKGMEFVSVRASLRGKRLQAHGRSVKVDLRGKTVGNYHVVMVAKYKTKSTGKIHTVRTIRTLSILRK